MIGAIIFERAVGFAVVEFASTSWLYEGFDLSTNVSSWLMFRSEPWTIPPGAVHSFGYPVGTSVALTDSIPIAAIFFKVLSPILPVDFQYFGLWLLLCFVLQALFGALLMRTITGSLPLQVLGATLFTLSPILVHRLGHTALCAHWLLLAALWLHVTRGERGHGWKAMAPSVILVGLAAGTHAYLAAMVAAVTAATIISRPASPRRMAPTLIVPALAVVLALLGVWWASGYFILGSSRELQTTGFGQLSMNLLAPIIPLRGMALDGQVPFSLV